MESGKEKLKQRLMGVIPLCLMFLLLLLPIVKSAGVSSQEATSEIVPRASSAEADGFIKPNEYDDALEIDLSNTTWEGYLYLKHDNKFLYVFLDHVSDTIAHPAGYDNCWVAIDCLSDSGDAPKEDDYLFHSSGHHIYVGDTQYHVPNGSWAEIIGHGEIPSELMDRAERIKGYKGGGTGAFGVSGNSMTPHRIFEIQIPIRGWEFEEANWTVGFCVAAGSPGTQGDFFAKAVWPDAAYGNFTGDFYAGGVRTQEPLVWDPEVGSFPPPNTWGTITLADVGPLSEPGLGDYWLYIAIVVVVAVIAIAAVVLLRKRK